MTARTQSANYVMLYVPMERAQRILTTLNLAEARVRKGGDTVLADTIKADAVDIEAQIYAR
jgi:hypothetical protein